jgi:hypothetical protein
VLIDEAWAWPVAAAASARATNEVRSLVQPRFLRIASS